MSLKGWGIAILLSPFTLGISIVAYFYYWFFKKVGIWYVRGLKIFLLMPLAIVLYVIVRILEGIIGDVEWVASIFTGGLSNMEIPEGKSPVVSVPGLSQFKLRYLGAFAVALIIDYKVFIEPLISGGVPEFSIHTFTSFFAVGLPFFMLVVFSGIVNKYWGTSVTKSAREASSAGIAAGAGAAGAAAAAPGAAAASGQEAVGQASELAETGAGMYEDIGTVGEAAETIGGEAVAAEGAEGILASVGGGSIASIGGPVVVAAIVAWVFYSIMAILMSIVLLGMTWGYITQLMPLIAGPIMGAIGLGGAYADWFGESASNQYGPQLGVAFEEERQAISQVGARLQCMLEGPQCLRQWQMNNTVRPGSQDVGQNYELRVEEFGLGVNRIDTAFKEQDYTLPINFLIANTRHGLKGITAEDVKYRIEIKDSDETICSTANEEHGEWRPINSQGLEADAAVAQDVNYILPGLGVSPTESLEELNLADCEMLQPSMGINRVIEMQVMYDYSSQATLYFDAMSREHRRDQGISPSFQQSETARTPVQSYINVQSPATFYETQTGQRQQVPFSARFGFETDYGVDYRIDPESVRIFDSDLTTHTTECTGLEPLLEEGENTYTISDRAEQRIGLRQDEGWFSSSIEPAPLRCTMELEDPDQISPTGEELLMRVDADYTVRLTEEMEAFSVWNTACERNTCPMLVTEEYNEYSDNDLFYECSGSSSIDSRDGCSIRVPPEGEQDMNWQLVNLAERDGEDITIREGTKAVRAQSFFEDMADSTRGSTEAIITDQTEEAGDMPVGVVEGREAEILAYDPGLVAYEREDDLNNIVYDSLRGALCEQQVMFDDSIGSNEEALNEYLDQWRIQNENANSYMFMTEIIDCERTIAEHILDAGRCSLEEARDLTSAAGSLLTLDAGDAYDDLVSNRESCMDNRERVEACVSGDEHESGVLVEERGDLACYGGSFG